MGIQTFTTLSEVPKHVDELRDRDNDRLRRSMNGVWTYHEPGRWLHGESAFLSSGPFTAVVPSEADTEARLQEMQRKINELSGKLEQIERGDTPAQVLYPWTLDQVPEGVNEVDRANEDGTKAHGSWRARYARLAGGGWVILNSSREEMKGRVVLESGYRRLHVIAAAD